MILLAMEIVFHILTRTVIAQMPGKKVGLKTAVSAFQTHFVQALTTIR